MYFLHKNIYLYKKMNILVTGGLGFIGHNLIKYIFIVFKHLRF